MVNMVELTALQTPDEACSIIAPGCLAQPNDPAAKALWESFMNLKQKEAVMEARRHLVEAASRENLPIKMSMGRVTPEQLSSYIQLFKNNLKALENHCGLLQLVLATVQTLKHPQISKWDNFLAFERLLLQSIGESEMPSVLNQLLTMIKSYSERMPDDYTCEDFLVLLVYMYSVVGEIKGGKELDKAEEEVKKALAKAICDEPEPSPLLQKITGAVGHHGDSLAEKILSVLPKLPGHKTDVMVNMVELTALQTPDEACSIIAPGCLAQPNDPAAKALWESFMNLKQKEAVMEARRHLVEAASRENLPIKMSMGRVTPEQLSSYIQLFKNNLKALENHCGLLQLVLATVQTLKHPQISKWDNFLAFERLLLQSIGESEMPSVLNQLLTMIKSYSERMPDDYTCEDFLVLLVYMYSVVGEIKGGKELDKAEEEVKKALAKAICDEPEPSPLLQKITVLADCLPRNSMKYL